MLYLIKKIFVLFLITTNILSWTAVGGINMSTIKYNITSVPFDVMYKPGLNFSLEKPIEISEFFGLTSLAATLKVGFGFIQRGVSNEYKQSEEYKLNSDEIYNYFSSYALYPLSLANIKKINFFIGFQSGLSIGGTSKLKISSEDNTLEQEESISAHKFNFDYGLLLAIDYTINDNFGSRFSYYIGFSDIQKNASFINAKNRGISLTMLYNL